MINSIDRVIFPLSGGDHLQRYDYIDNGIIGVPYVSIPLEELHKAVKTIHELGIQIVVINNVSVYRTRQNASIAVKRKYKSSKGLDVFIPELYTSVDYDWLLEQVSIIEKGVDYTGNCLLHGTGLVVFNIETPYRNIKPTTLIEVFTKALKHSMKDKEELINLITSNMWGYFTKFINVEKSTGEVALFSKAKYLIADMKLRNMQGTTVYCILQAISNLVNDLQQEQLQKTL